MSLKIFGAAIVVIGCGYFGFCLVNAHRKEVRYLRSLLSALNFINCELQYQLTPLPDLFRKTSTICETGLKKLFLTLSNELENQVSPNVQLCMASAVRKVSELPEKTRLSLLYFGKMLGRFDVDGQMQGIEATQAEVNRFLKELSDNQDVRLRSYQTLALCAGAAIVILFI